MFNRSNSYAYRGALIGDGTLRQIGSGTTILAGDLTRFTGNTEVSGGTLQLESLPVGDMTVANTATIDFALLKDAVFQGAVTGNGQLLKSTNSVLTLSGDNNGFTGQTKVNAGTLVITGSFGGDYSVGNGAVLIADGNMKGGLTVTAGGLLGGTGVLGDLTIETGGVHAPGHSPVPRPSWATISTMALCWWMSHLMSPTGWWLPVGSIFQAQHSACCCRRPQPRAGTHSTALTRSSQIRAVMPFWGVLPR
ncbi:hypothetical protein HGG75_24940 [Ochrobactrum pseudogrignonense]|nr:hypothetical protein [Brucella pseudogrignonensis]